jgi:mannose-6-phosphate isomerase
MKFSMTKLAPFRLRPWFRTRVWGVRELSPWYDYKVGDEPIGEVWLSGDTSVVDNGPRAGQPFSRIFQDHREELLGDASAHLERFPLLMKILFPHEKLSVQVHPGDALARQAGEPHGKTECWYALDAEPGAAVALGLHPGTTLGQVKSAIDANTLEDLLECVPVEKGDMIFVDAGTIHAIGPGSVLLETQQNSDMTYRLYDYGRPRELHLEQGLKATRVHTDAGKVQPRIVMQTAAYTREILIESQYFRVDRYRVPESGTSIVLKQDPSTVQLVFAASGSGTLQAVGNGPAEEPPIHLRRGELAVVPACIGECNVTSAEPMEFLCAIPK